MPANLETKIVVTGNYRAWRHFLAMRGSLHADAEIRTLAIDVWEALMVQAPNVFNDFVYEKTLDGFDYLWSPIMEVA
jgi:thymidylate synthase (FAD)